MSLREVTPKPIGNIHQQLRPATEVWGLGYFRLYKNLEPIHGHSLDRSHKQAFGLRQSFFRLRSMLKKESNACRALLNCMVHKGLLVILWSASLVLNSSAKPWK